MWRRKLAWQLYIGYLAMAIVPLVAVIWLSSGAFRDFYMQKTAEDVTARTLLVRQQIELEWGHLSAHQIDSVCKSIGKAISTRVTVIARNGRVIGDSDKDPDSMENHANRPEVLAAISGKTDTVARLSTTLGERMLYVATPFHGGDSLAGVVRLARPVSAIEDLLAMYHRRILIIGAILALLAIMVSFGVARRFTLPIEAMREGAKRFASGDLGFKLVPPTQEELRSLAESLNHMAGQLDERIRTITQQRNEHDAVFSSMVEGVIAVDMNDRIIAMNPAAGKILGIDHRSSQGLWIHEVIRNSDLQKFLGQTVSAAATPVEGAIVFEVGRGERHLQAHGTALYDAGGKPFGALVVLNDITRLRRLENIRKDFVANVSHELRTPLTAIKGFVETILAEPDGLPEKQRHFLDIINVKVDRLCSIIDDLLSLSSLERESERSEIPFEVALVRMTLASAIEDCSRKAREKNIGISLVCDENLTAVFNPPLIEQAVVNLLDNGIKYSDNATEIAVSAAAVNGETILTVTDHGIGIAPEHHERLFERFYRVDKARSRKMGGTGLGLSIVKNIAAAHGGRVSMESMPGKGSTFRIHLPDSPDRRAGQGRTPGNGVAPKSSAATSESSDQTTRNS